MSDPAIEASRRAFNQMWPDQGDFEFSLPTGQRKWADTAAREALKPIRELHKPIGIDGKSCPLECEEHEDPDDCPDVTVDVCRYCYDLALQANSYYGEEEGISSDILWPCPTAKLAYTTTEELAS